VLDDIEEAKELLKDKDMADFAKEELTNAEEKKNKLESELEVLLIPHDPNDEKNVIVDNYKFLSSHFYLQYQS
jgi:peptide chain release factor 1